MDEVGVQDDILADSQEMSERERETRQEDFYTKRVPDSPADTERLALEKQDENMEALRNALRKSN